MKDLQKYLKEKKELSVACVVIIILLAVTIFLAFSKQIPKTKNGSQIIASVKGYEITTDKLYKQLKNENGINTVMNLIDKYIADKEVKFTEEDEEYVNNIVDYYKQYAEYYGITFEEFLTQYAGDSGATTEKEFYNLLKEDYKKSLAAINYVGKQLTKEEIQEYYDENYSETMTVKHILIAVDEDESEKDAIEEAKDIINQLNEVKDDSEKLNETFKDLAFNHSSDGTYANEGLIENFTKKDVVSSFWDAAYDLKDGEFTQEPVKSEYGYHVILKVNSTSQEKLKDIKDKVVKALAQQKISENSNLQITAWDELRKKYKLKINDSDIKKAYNDAIKKANNTEETEEEVEE